MGTKMAANFHCTPVTPGKAFGILYTELLL